MVNLVRSNSVLRAQGRQTDSKHSAEHPWCTGKLWSSNFSRRRRQSHCYHHYWHTIRILTFELKSGFVGESFLLSFSLLATHSVHHFSMHPSSIAFRKTPFLQCTDEARLTYYHSVSEISIESSSMSSDVASHILLLFLLLLGSVSVPVHSHYHCADMLPNHEIVTMDNATCAKEGKKQMQTSRRRFESNSLPNFSPSIPYFTTSPHKNRIEQLLYFNYPEPLIRVIYRSIDPDSS